MKKFVFSLLIVFFEIGYTMPAQVIIIRHANRNDQLDLTGAGIERAQALASYFTIPNDNTTPGFVGHAGLTNVALFNYGPPVALYAQKTPQLSTGVISLMIQTISPTALVLNLPVHSLYGSGEEIELAQSVLQNPEYDGKNVLICWSSTYIPALIEAFGYHCRYLIYPPDRYDFVWVMTFPAPNPPVIINPTLQELLDGDPNTFP